MHPFKVDFQIPLLRLLLFSENLAQLVFGHILPGCREQIALPDFGKLVPEQGPPVCREGPALCQFQFNRGAVRENTGIPRPLRRTPQAFCVEEARGKGCRNP